MQAFENFTLALVDHTHSVCAFDNIVATKKFPYQKNIISNVHFAVCVLRHSRHGTMVRASSTNSQYTTLKSFRVQLFLNLVETTPIRRNFSAPDSSPLIKSGQK